MIHQPSGNSYSCKIHITVEGSEQVDYSVNSLVLFNNISNANEFYYEDVVNEWQRSGVFYNDIVNSYKADHDDLPENFEETEEFWDYENEYYMYLLDSMYQTYIVDIDSENEETERLGIWYDNELDAYFLPVFHFGTAWIGVPQMNYDSEN